MGHNVVGLLERNGTERNGMPTIQIPVVSVLSDLQSSSSLGRGDVTTSEVALRREVASFPTTRIITYIRAWHSHALTDALDGSARVLFTSRTCRGISLRSLGIAAALLKNAAKRPQRKTRPDRDPDVVSRQLDHSAPRGSKCARRSLRWNDWNKNVRLTRRLKPDSGLPEKKQD